MCFSYITGWWFGTFGLFFHSVGNFIIPTDDLHHFQRGRLNHQPDKVTLNPLVNIIVFHIKIATAGGIPAISISHFSYPCQVSNPFMD